MRPRAQEGRRAREAAKQAARDAWLRAVQEEDASAAGWCARLCETLQGAEDFAETEGLDAFLSVARGQSARTGKGGMMQALAQAAVWDMSTFKVAIFETLAAAGHWPSLRGRVVGSDILGIVAVALLAKSEDGSPKHPPAVRALMVRLCALTVDAPEVVKLGDERRAKEFAVLREKLIEVRAFEAMAAMAAPGTEAVAAAAAANAIGALAGYGGDAKVRAKLLEVGAVAQLLAHLPSPGDGGGAAGGAGANDPGADGPAADSSGADGPGAVGAGAVGSAADGPAAGSPGADGSSADGPGADGPGADGPSAGGPEAGKAAADSASAAGGGSDSEDDKSGATNTALGAVVGALSAIAATEGEGTQALLLEIAAPPAVQRLRSLLTGDGAHRSVVEHAMACLLHVGRRTGVWPECDEVLGADLARLLFFNSEAGAPLLAGLLRDRARAARLGDLRPLRRALEVRMASSRAAGATKVFEDIQGCDRCGRATEAALLVCGGCRRAAYCGHGCQKAAWKEHKEACKRARPQD